LRIPKLFHDDAGVTAVEYTLIAALIALACIIAFNLLGLELADIFNTVANALDGTP
jgi:pilus assembly protein Flp/PilA